MGRKSMPNANFVHRTTAIKVNYPSDRPKGVGASIQNTQLNLSGEIDVKKSVAFDKASASKKDVNESLIEVYDGNHTDRMSINHKDEE